MYNASERTRSRSICCRFCYVRFFVTLIFVASSHLLMSQTFTRQELFDLVWSEPMKTLAGRFELSDVGLAKACKKANIPRPPRGYWAKLAAGKKVARSALPTRGPGMFDEIEIGGGRYGYHRSHSENEILNANVQPPVFDDSIEEVAERVKATIPRVTVPRFHERAHRQIRRLLDADEERRQKQLASRFPSSWDDPLFDDAFETRRLRVLNAIITALEKADMKPSVQGRYARNLSVGINDINVQFTLDATTQKDDPFRDASIHTRGSSNILKFQILSWGPSSSVRMSWEDKDKTKLESYLTDIVVELIVSGERQYRKSRQGLYEWMVERKANLLEEIQKRKEEAERKERENLAALEKARVDQLLGDAAAFRQAADIRAFVADVEARFATGDVSVSQGELEAWHTWALAQAERIDPVRSGRFVVSMMDKSADEGAGEDGAS